MIQRGLDDSIDITPAMLWDMYKDLAGAFVKYEDMVAYVRGILIEKFDSDLVLEGTSVDVSATMDGVTFGQHFGTVLLGAFQSSKKALLTCASSSWVGICKQLKSIFEKTLGCFLETFVAKCPWIGKYWEIVSGKATELYEKTMPFLSGCRELLQIGMALIASVAMVTFAERFLVAMNILAEPIGLTKLFVPAAIAIFGITGFMEFTAGGGNVKDSLFGMVINFLTLLPKWLVPDKRINNVDRTKGQFAPSSILCGFSSMVNSYSTAGLVEAGKSAQAINSITNAVKNLKNGAMAGVTYVAGALETLLGTQEAELSDISIVLGLGLQDWLSEIDALEEHFNLVQSSSKDLLMRATILSSKGAKLVAAIATKAITPSSQVTNILVKANERVRKLKDALMLQGSGGQRIMPFVVAFVGASRTGKTLLTSKMAKSICEHDGLPDLNVYSRQPQDPFWSGYRRQHVVIQDDFAACEHDVSDESSLMMLVSSQECRLNMADLAEKGMFFDSGAFIYSSNFEDASPHSKVHDRNAFRNRRNVVIRVEIDHTKEYSPKDPTKNQKYSILNFVDGQSVVVESFESYADLECFVLNKYAAHVEEKRANIASTSEGEPIKTGMHSMFEFFAADSRDIREVTKVEIDEDMKPFLIWMNQIWCIKNRQLVCLPYESKSAQDSPGIMSLGRSLEALRMAPNMNTISLLYLEKVMKQLREGPNWTISLDEWSTEPHIQEFIRSLTLEQRVVLILCHKEFCRQNHDGTWVGRLTKIMVESKDKLLAAIARWPLYAKAAMGITLAVVLGGALWQVLKVLAGLCTGAGFTTAGGCLGYAHSMAQSREPTRNTGGPFRFRNIPTSARHRTRGQSDEEISSAQVAARHMVNVRVGESEVMAMILPGKKLLMVNHFARRILQPIRAVVQRSDGVDLFCCLDPARKELIADSELATFYVPSLPDVRKSAMSDICWDPEMLAANDMQVILYTFKRCEEMGCYMFEFCKGMGRKISKRLAIENDDYVREIPRYLSYTIATENMDCGGLVLTRTKSGWQIIGMHVAGDGVTGQACYIPVGLKEQADTKIPTSKGQCEIEDFVEFYPTPVAVGASLTQVGKLKEKLFMPSKTKLKEVPKEWQIFGAETKEPSILSSTDPRVPEHHRPFDVYEKGMRKYKQSCGELQQDVLDEVVREMVDEFRDVGAGKFRSVDMNTALNGKIGCEHFDSIVTATSEGFAWIYERENNKGKTRYLEGEPGAWKLPEGGPMDQACKNLELSAREGVTKPLVGIECVKDELLPMRKIYGDPKSRLFTVLPMEYNLVLRKLTLPFVAWMMSNRGQLASQVGINPYSREWNDMAMRLQSKGNDILCCDYSSFDGLCTPQLMEAMCKIIGSFYDRTESRAICTLLMTVFQRYSVCDFRVFQVFGGIPSGIALTVILNSLMNELLVRYCWKRLMSQHGRVMVTSFRVHCEMVVYGDDNLISVGPAVKSVFNGKTLKAEMERLGVTITDGIDKTSPVLEFRRLQACDFLKRGFKLNKYGLWTGPQERLSLFSQLMYIRESSYDSLAEGFRVNAENVLRELWLHGPEIAKEFRDAYHGLGLSKLPSLAVVEAFHEEQMGNDPQPLTYDLFENTAFLGSLAATTSEKTSLQMTPRVHACTVGLAPEGSFLVCLQTPVPLGREGMNVNFRVGIGRGGLPTADTLRMMFANSGAATRKTILTHYQSGKTISFVSPNGNVVAMICALVWLRACKLVERSYTSVGLQKAIEVCSRLEYDRELQELILDAGTWSVKLAERKGW